MFRLIGCIVVYNTKFDEISQMIKEFYKENIGQHLVIVDNSNTGYLEEKIKNINSDIDYILNENTGYGSGNNLAITKYKKKAEYFLVLNPDIYITINDLKRLLSYADGKKEFGIIMPKITFLDGENQYLCKLLPTPVNLFLRRFLPNSSLLQKLNYNYEYRFTNYDKVMEVPFFSGCFMLCNYKNLIKENGFDERYFMYMEDVDLSRRMFKYKNYFYPDVEVHHGFGKASFKSLKMTFVHVKSAVRYFNKWGWFFDKERKKININMLRKYKREGEY